MLDHPADHLGGSTALAVVEGNREIVGGLSLSHVVLGDGHGEGRMRDDTIVNTGDLDGDFIEGEVFAGGKAAAEGEHS